MREKPLIVTTLLAIVQLALTFGGRGEEGSDAGSGEWHRERHLSPSHNLPIILPSTPLNSRTKRKAGKDITFAYTTPELIHAHGFPVEVHDVITDDGYILEVHRIPPPPHRYEDSATHYPMRGRVVFVQHCVLCSSADFVLNDRKHALAYMLSDAGYDVWLGNYRGTQYGDRHIYMSKADPEFWKFSFMEMAHYDIPNSIDYVMNITGAKKISYIGHSMGTSGFFAATSLKPYFNDKINVMVAMAPVAYLDDVKGILKFIFEIHSKIFLYRESRGKGEVSARTKAQEKLARILCSHWNPFAFLCQVIVPFFGGINPGYIDKKYLPIILSHIPSSTSSRTLAHLGQLAGANQFQMFDMGPEGNYRAYGQPNPPPYEIWNVRVPVGLFWSYNDYVSRPRDIKKLARILPNVVYNYVVPQKDFNHLDFLFSKTARKVLYIPVINFLNYYNSHQYY